MRVFEQTSLFLDILDDPIGMSIPVITTPAPADEAEDEWDVEVDPEILLEHFFEGSPTVGQLRQILAAFPDHVPVFVNGEGHVSAIELIDPTHSGPFRHIVPEVHVVIG